MMTEEKVLEIKNYLLGIETEKAEQIEERLMSDDEFFQDFLAIEEELIQEYVDDELSSEEKQQFEKHFLISNERLEKLKFAQSLRRHNEKNAADKVTKSEAKNDSGIFKFFSGFLASPIPVAICLLIIAGLSAVLVWNFYLKSSDSEYALASLNKAFKDERPFESRISEFEYAPKRTTRGNDDSKINQTELDIAQFEIPRNATKNPNAENLYALGKLYLTKKEFEKAIKNFESAEKLDANNAQIQNDLGVAYLEKSILSKDKTVQLELNDRALKSFDKALEIDPKFLDALFNKALTLQNLPMPRQAKQTWEEYLKLDSNSKWADEARKKIQELEPSTRKELNNKQWEEEFIKVQNSKDEDKAFELVSQNRELVNEKYLPQRLAKSYILADVDKRARYLEALKFLGELEKKKIKDNFASDLANFYKNISVEKFEVLKNAQTSMGKGYEALLVDDFPLALENFQNANKFFLEAENIFEANTINAILIGYCLTRTTPKDKDLRIKQIEHALAITENSYNFTKEKKYIWLNSLSAYWLEGIKNAANKGTFLEKKNRTEENLIGVRQIGDSMLRQALLISLADDNNFLSKNKETKAILKELFEYSGSSNNSVRQKMRNYGIGTEILVRLDLKSISKATVLETLAVAEESGKNQLTLNYQINSGIVHTLAGDYQNGEKWLKVAYNNASKIEDERSKSGFLTKINMYLGHLERTRQNFEISIKYYDEAKKYMDDSLPTQKFEIQKSSLLANQGANKFDEVDKNITEVLNLAEKYRSEILDEQERTSFFDNEQTIYEIAVENELHKNNAEIAYNFAELSRSRSLLDWLHKGAKVFNENEETEIVFEDSSKPLELREIQKRMPNNVQILQYTVLEDRLLMWLISQEKFDFSEVKIDEENLNDEVKQYLNLIKNNENEPEQKRLAKLLHQKLITPISAKLDSTKYISIIPDKILFHIPFVALIDDKGKYLAENFITFYSPSANVLVLSSENAKAKNNSNDEKLLVIGNPNFDKQKFPKLENLPNAETEAKNISAIYTHQDSKLIIGSEATEQTFLRHSTTANIIHFAGHYVVENGLPLNSGLVMADENSDEHSILNNAQLIRQKFPETKLIILSACDTGVESFSNSDGLIGISRTFLAAGVPTVVGSQWKVSDSKVTSDLMSKFHKFRNYENQSNVKALNSAQREIIASNNSPNLWAAFGVYGGFSD